MSSLILQSAYIKRKNDYGQWQAKLISKTSYPYLETYIQSKDKSSAPETTTAEEELIKKTYEYYNSELEEEKLKRIYPALEEFSYAEILTFIRDQILATRVIVIDTPDKKLAYEIFEILNAKGKSLASIDLIKNKIISVFHGDENGKDKLIEEKWENIKSILRSRENDVGLATFYRHYWISKYKKTTNVKLYDDFINFIEQDETDQDNLKNK